MDGHFESFWGLLAKWLSGGLWRLILNTSGVLYAIYGTSAALGSICTLFTVLPLPWVQSARYLRYFRSLGLDLHAIYGTSDPLALICTYLRYFRSPGFDLHAIYGTSAPWGSITLEIDQEVSGCLF